MIMKKYIFIMCFAAAFFALSAAVQAQNIRIIVNDVTPQPAEPGNDLTLRVTFNSIEKDTISGLKAYLDLRQPFVLKTSTEPFESGFDLCGFCQRTNTYFISVDKDANSGIYPIFVRYTSAAGSESFKTVNVSVKGSPNIVLVADPVNNATPADVFDLRTEVKNIGTGNANQIKIVSKSSDFVSIGGSVATLGSIGAKNSSFVAFRMSTNEDLKAGSYNLPFEVNYKDELGILYNVTQNIGVRVVNDGMLSIQSIKVASASGQPSAGKPLSVIIRLENIGNGDVDSIDAEITCDGQKARTFLGQLKRDEDAPAVFDIIIPSGGKHECTMVTNYADDTGRKTLESRFDIIIAGSEPPFMIIILVVIVIGAAYYYYRKRHHARKHKSDKG